MQEIRAAQAERGVLSANQIPLLKAFPVPCYCLRRAVMARVRKLIKNSNQCWP